MAPGRRRKEDAHQPGALKKGTDGFPTLLKAASLPGGYSYFDILGSLAIGNR
jgi:hypothetical protein